MNSRRSKVFIVDDYAPMRVSLRKLLEFEKDLAVCGDASSIEEAVKGIRTSKPDAAIVDLVLERETGLELLKRLKAERMKVPVLILSMLPEDLNAETLLENGAKGYLMKSEPADTVLLALRCVLSGNIYLSPAMDKKLNAQQKEKHSHE